MDKILAYFFSDIQNDFHKASYRKSNTNDSYRKAKVRIIDLLVKCLPKEKEILLEDKNRMGIQMVFKDGWNACRTLTLNNLEELK